jgi:hypothetical protein
MSPRSRLNRSPSLSRLQSQRRIFVRCARVATYLKETKAHKSKKTFAAYRETLHLFAEVLTGKSLEEIDWTIPHRTSSKR